MSASATTARRNVFLFELKRLELEANLALQCINSLVVPIELGLWRIVVVVLLLRQLGDLGHVESCRGASSLCKSSLYSCSERPSPNEHLGRRRVHTRFVK